jgi:hypothetical protein
VRRKSERAPHGSLPEIKRSSVNYCHHKPGRDPGPNKDCAKVTLCIDPGGEKKIFRVWGRFR